jgi:CRP-like cAMP-binding protein
MSAVRLSDEVLDELYQICTRRQFRPGEKITVKGERPKAMFFILDGWVDIRFYEDSGGTTSLRVGEKSALGEMSFLSGKRAVATAVAVCAVTALELDKDTLDALEAKNPQAASEFSRYLANTVDRRLQ